MVTYPTSPVLIDKFLVEFNQKIVQKLTWLNNPLGKVQEISQHLEDRYVLTPAMFTDGEEYIDVLPSDEWTNFSWFVFDPLQINGVQRRAKIKSKAWFNMFLDLNKIYPGETKARNLENVKSQVLTALQTISLLSAAVRVQTISERYADVYKGFKINEVEDKYFMQPYAGLSFTLDVYLRNNTCNPEQWTADSATIDASGTDWDASGAIF